jgi:hypothetical protein
VGALFRSKEPILQPTANHSVPFLLVRSPSNPPGDDEDFDTHVDARRAVKPRLPPPRANVNVDDLPSVIVDEPAPGPRRAQAQPAPVPAAPQSGSVVVDVDEEWSRRSNPTLVMRSSPPPQKNRVGRAVAAAIVMVGVVGAVGGALGVVDVHSVMPRAIASILHR